ncbi:MAG TPA: hypothetical protein VF417_01170, partial [Candidatus Methylomirabilis sp.]
KMKPQTPLSNDQLIRAVGLDIESRRLLVIPLPREEWVGLAPSALPSEPLPTPAPPIAPAKEKVELLVSIDREPPVASSANARFILSASDGSYRAEKGVGDDRVPGNDSIDLRWTGRDP